MEQRRAWMIVRHVLLLRYARYDMIDAKRYDPTLYPLSIEALPADFEPKWSDMSNDGNEESSLSWKINRIELILFHSL